MKKALVIAILTSMLIVFAPKVKAATANSNVVGINKCWKIHFNQPVSMDTVYDGITVVDSKGNKVNVFLSFSTDEKTVEVNPPMNGYKENENYTLTIGSKVSSQNKLNIKKQSVFQFTTKGNKDEEVVSFKDTNLEKEVRKAAKKPTGDLTRKDVESIRYLYSGGNNIKSLAGIENLTNLYTISLDYNEISDITPLKGLKNLEDLNLEGNQISDITPLKNLRNLYNLSLEDNKVSDISALSDLNTLEYLSLGKNQITDIGALSNLTKLKVLSINDNLIKDINPVSKMIELNKLSISGNFLSNIECLKQISKLNTIDGEDDLPRYFLAYEEANQLIKDVVKPDMSEVDKEKVIFNCLVNYTTDVNIKALAKKLIIANSFLGDSLGYAKATRLLFNMLGIKCTIIKGTAGLVVRSETHYWNMVEIGGKYYHVDTNWYDPSLDENGDMKIYEFFNANDSVMKNGNHIWNYNEYPKCE